MKNIETVENACKKLKKQGWNELPDRMRPYAKYFYKRFKTPTRCCGNKENEGIQIEIRVSDGMAGGASFEICIYGGLNDGTWVQFLNYSLPKNLKCTLALIPRILRAWEAVNKEVAK